MAMVVDKLKSVTLSVELVQLAAKRGAVRLKEELPESMAKKVSECVARESPLTERQWDC